MPCIYKIESPSGSVYIGQTWNYSVRISFYERAKCKNQNKLYHSILKYGWDSHKISISHELPEDVDQNTLDLYETIYWKSYKDLGFNMLNLREPGSRGKHTDESRRKLSETKKRQYTENPDMFNSFKKSAIGKKMSEESKRKMSEKLSGPNNPNYGKCGEEHWNYGKPSPKRGKSLSPEIVERSRNAMKHLMKPINMYDLSGNLLNTFDSIKGAARILKIQEGSIRHNLYGKSRKVSGKWVFKFLVS